ncbi:hypothetical protein AKJ47_02670 [candidate division MSBL1 archaeon SCGC-AAA261G05]|uniref:Uncharacterized protein n=2 Tax=candidate division MSBL1 TaxID=215777 RepID=A0A133V9S8_9EURY|nr:hypothetical protein AKJ47_02670 [candidate division MSBL1 archaeon SCGC-AAA261G05]KXB04089.1 hypothetical protein AKJ48_03400 [candidate division MSBL1 archaeon SCGC-AAA261O19]
MNIEETGFGWITIDGKKYDHDLVIYPNAIEERKKWITKEKHGTSHMFTRKEMEEYLKNVEPEEIEVVVIGTGQYGKLGLLDEAKKLLEENEIEAVELKTPKAVERFEEGEEPRSRKLGIFHVTC